MIPFSIWVMGGEAYNAPPPMDYGSRKSAMDERVIIHASDQGCVVDSLLQIENYSLSDVIHTPNKIWFRVIIGSCRLSGLSLEHFRLSITTVVCYQTQKQNF